MRLRRSRQGRRTIVRATSLRDRKGQAIRERTGWNSAGSRPGSECAVGHRTEIASPGRTKPNRRSSRNEITIDRPSRINSGGQELITAMPDAPWNRIGKAVVEQASMCRRRGAGRCLVAEVLDLRGVPDGWICGRVCCFRRGNSSNRGCRRRLITRHPGPEQVRDRDHRDDQDDGHHDQQFDHRKAAQFAIAVPQGPSSPLSSAGILPAVPRASRPRCGGATSFPNDNKRSMNGIRRAVLYLSVPCR